MGPFSSSVVSVLRMKDVLAVPRTFLEVTPKGGMRHPARHAPRQRPLGWGLFLRKTTAFDGCRNHWFPSAASRRIVGVWLFYVVFILFYVSQQGEDLVLHDDVRLVVGEASFAWTVTDSPVHPSF